MAAWSGLCVPLTATSIQHPNQLLLSFIPNQHISFDNESKLAKFELSFVICGGRLLCDDEGGEEKAVYEVEFDYEIIFVAVCD